MTRTDSNPVFIAKKAAGHAAAEVVEEGMFIGLGTGTTAAFFIEALAKRCREGLKIQAIATSEQSALHAQHLGIPLIQELPNRSIDITFDGADEIDHHKNMIKGGGGALLREKLLALASQEMIVIIDETKLVDQLGNHPLPIEIVPFIYSMTIKRLEQLGYTGKLRNNRLNQPFLTDNGNFIFDIQYSGAIDDPEKEHVKLKNISGVVETGLFFNVAKRVIVGYEDGLTKTLS